MAKHKQLTIAPVNSINLAAALPPDTVNQLVEAQLSNQRLEQQVNASLILVRRSIAKHVADCRAALNSATAILAEEQTNYDNAVKQHIHANVDELVANVLDSTSSDLPLNLRYVVDTDKVKVTYTCNTKDSDGDPIGGNVHNFDAITIRIPQRYEYTDPYTSPELRVHREGYHTPSPRDIIDLPFAVRMFATSTFIYNIRQHLALYTQNVNECKEALDKALLEQGKLPIYEQDLRDSMTVAAARATTDGNDQITAFAEDILSRLNIPTLNL